MNKTETKAYQWLLKQGYSEDSMIFQPRRTPDFVCSDGKGYEVKRMYGKNTIWLYADQAEELAKNKDAEILVFSDDNDEPIARLPSFMLKGGVVKGIRLLVLCRGMKHVIISDDTWQGLMTLKIKHKKKSIDATIKMLLETTEK